ncbi:TonB-dependent receptor domain-containing protein [Motiliproteus sp.]|uniref:TonB-dependent receptor domain-containing protein n=1 Tax=Motiliproteus sp. TaxID=1898955 RepID=UPI003BAAD3D2
MAAGLAAQKLRRHYNTYAVLGLLQLLLLSLPNTARAEFRWDVGGFLSQGWVTSDHNSFYGDSSGSGGTFDFRELGVNGFIQLDPRLKLSGQLLSRRAGKISDGDPQVDYLFADIFAVQQLQRQAGVRVGRIKNALGFFNETRDMAFTRPGLILPQSIYFDQVRELQHSSDGVALYYRQGNSLGEWQLDLQYGRLQTGENTEALFLGGVMNGEFGNSMLALARLQFEPQASRWRMGLTRAHLDLPFNPAAGDPLTKGELDVEMTVLSLQHNRERLSFTAEAMLVDTRWKNLGILPDHKTLQAYYLQVDYRFTDQWQAMVRYDDLVLDKDDRDGVAFNMLTGRPAHLQFAQDWSLGLRYQPSQNWDLRAEVHRVDGTAWLSKKDNPDAELRRRWNMLLVQAAYRF